MTVEVARRHYMPDALTMFGEDIALTATGYVQDEDDADVVIRLGAGRNDVSLVIDITAMDVLTNDELYTFRIIGANAEAFTGNVAVLATLQVGAEAALWPEASGSLAAADDATGRWVVGFSNSRGSVEYQYVKLHVTVTAAGSAITFTAFITRPE